MKTKSISFKKNIPPKTKKAWLVAVNMGYGHQRTAYPLRSFAGSPDFFKGKFWKIFDRKMINANDYEGIPERDKRLWKTTQRLYELISNFKRIPLIGDLVFSAFDVFQKILSYYPKRNLSKPNLAVKQIFFLLKKGWGKDLIEKLKEKPLPFITTFFTPAFMADFLNYPEDIFCVICDADINRAWVALDPSKSKIKYFAPNDRVVNRLRLYGLKESNIFLTGYPLPLENIGTKRMEILKEDLGYRILNLDPKKKYFKKYKSLIEDNIGKLPRKSDHPLTLMFSVGGAGAQKEIGIRVVKSLAGKIRKEQIKIILSAGIKDKVIKFFLKNLKKLDLEKNLGTNIELVFAKDVETYFQNFNQALRKTDILWTKPSELSFYSALGLPIIIAPTIGSQEDFNKRWLLKSGFGILQENPTYTDQWLFDWLEQGYFAKCAMQGFIEGEKLGTLKIKEIALKSSG